jgi:flagellar biosynthesis component FlhA
MAARDRWEYWMARRLGKNAHNARGLFVLFLAVTVAFVALLLALLARNPALLVILMLAGGIVLIFWRSKTRGERWQQLQEARRRETENYAAAQAERRRQLQEARREAEIYAARVTAIESYHTMTFREFEEALAWLCRRDGCPGRRT